MRKGTGAIQSFVRVSWQQKIGNRDMLPRTGSTWERMIIALRVVPILPGKSHAKGERDLDAGSLVRRGARTAAIGMAVGQVASDGDELRVRVLHIDIAQARGYECSADHGVDCEPAVLESFAGQLSLLNHPLIVTAGGRRTDLPFLRYRCLAQGVDLAALHLPMTGKLTYFDRYDQNWHLDLCDILCGQGASIPLTLAELCCLCGLDCLVQDVNGDRALCETTLVFGLFVNTMRVMGRLSASQHRQALLDLCDAATRFAGPVSTEADART